MRRFSAVLRSLSRNGRTFSPFVSSVNTFPPYSRPRVSSRPFFTATASAEIGSPQKFSLLHRSLCSSSSGPSNIVLIDSEETFNNSIRKAQDEALPGILYFTAAWCGPCRLLSPVITQLCEKYPHVTVNKIDIDQEELGKKLSELSIHSVPTLHFFKDGQKASEMVGADVERLKHTMAKLYE